VIVRSASNTYVDGRALVYGEIVELERTDEVEAGLVAGRLVELDEAGAAVMRSAPPPATRGGCCGG